MKLPSRNNCPECSDQYFEYRQSRANRRSIHERIGIQFPEGDRRLKINDSERQRRKRIADQNWANYDDEEEDYQEYVWQKGQWCPPGLRKSQRRRVQRLRSKELKQAAAERRQVWRPKRRPDKSGPSAEVSMAFFPSI